jgi:hypothetical protein
MKFSLRTLFIVFTAACLLCGGALGSGIVTLESVLPVQGNGVRLRAGSLSAGWVDFRGDDRGTLVGIWREPLIEDGSIGPAQTIVPLLEIEFNSSVKLAGLSH